jgi:hypothetical protein
MEEILDRHSPVTKESLLLLAEIWVKGLVSNVLMYVFCLLMNSE